MRVAFERAVRRCGAAAYIVFCVTLSVNGSGAGKIQAPPKKLFKSAKAVAGGPPVRRFRLFKFMYFFILSSKC